MVLDRTAHYESAQHSNLGFDCWPDEGKHLQLDELAQKLLGFSASKYALVVKTSGNKEI